MTIDACIDEAYKTARERLKRFMSLNQISQAELASRLDRSPGAFSQRLSNNSLSLWQDLPKVFPPACWIAARLYEELSNAHDKHYETNLDAMEKQLLELVVEMEKSIPNEGDQS